MACPGRVHSGASAAVFNGPQFKKKKPWDPRFFPCLDSNMARISRIIQFWMFWHLMIFQKTVIRCWGYPMMPRIYLLNQHPSWIGMSPCKLITTWSTIPCRVNIQKEVENSWFPWEMWSTNAECWVNTTSMLIYRRVILLANHLKWPNWRSPAGLKISLAFYMNLIVIQN